MKQILGSLALGLIILFISVSKVSASEGTFELRNRVGESARCYATSVLMQDRNYNVLISCRDILYPGGTNVFEYVIWATPLEGGNPFRLGTVDLGKILYKTKTPFSSIFVTKEEDDRPRSPQGPTVMAGNLEIITFLDNPTTADLNPTNELGEPEVTPEPTETPSRGGIGRIIAAGGVLAFIAIFGLVLVLFVISRRR